jgi:hypothetical protein
MCFASDVARQASLHFGTQPLAQLLVGNIAAQHFNLHEQVKSKILSPV